MAEIIDGKTLDMVKENLVKLQEIYPDCDVQMTYGGQPIYYYYISLE